MRRTIATLSAGILATGAFFACERNVPVAPRAGADAGFSDAGTPAVFATGRFVEPQGGPVYPARVAPAADGAVFVSDPRQNKVFGLRDGVPFAVIENVDRPLGLAVSGNLLFVGNRGRGTVEVYDFAARRFVRSLGVGANEFGMPNAVAVSPDGRVFVADSAAHYVKVYRPDGTWLRSIGGRGSSDGRFRFPSALAVDGNDLVVGDQGNHRVQVFDPDGAFRFSFGDPVETGTTSWGQFTNRFSRIQGIALSESRIFVLDSYHSHVQVFDRTGRSLGFLGGRGTCESCVGLALDLARDLNGMLVLTDPERSRLVSVSGEVLVAPQ